MEVSRMGKKEQKLETVGKMESEGWELMEGESWEKIERMSLSTTPTCEPLLSRFPVVFPPSLSRHFHFPSIPFSPLSGCKSERLKKTHINSCSRFLPTLLLFEKRWSIERTEERKSSVVAFLLTPKRILLYIQEIWDWKKDIVLERKNLSIFWERRRIEGRVKRSEDRLTKSKRSLSCLFLWSRLNLVSSFLLHHPTLLVYQVKKGNKKRKVILKRKEKKNGRGAREGWRRKSCSEEKIYSLPGALVYLLFTELNSSSDSRSTSFVRVKLPLSFSSSLSFFLPRRK